MTRLDQNNRYCFSKSQDLIEVTASTREEITLSIKTMEITVPIQEKFRYISISWRYIYSITNVTRSYSITQVNLTRVRFQHFNSIKLSVLLLFLGLNYE